MCLQAIDKNTKFVVKKPTKEDIKEWMNDDFELRKWIIESGDATENEIKEWTKEDPELKK